MINISIDWEKIFTIWMNSYTKVVGWSIFNKQNDFYISTKPFPRVDTWWQINQESFSPKKNEWETAIVRNTRFDNLPSGSK